MESGANPLVSIGVPVYNGETTIARALDSLLAQDYSNVEIVISDNGSIDGTRSICETYASRDPRIKYHRSEQNMGASWNFNRVFQLSRGEYFMWAAHDDVRHPRFVSACVGRMQECPHAVLCQARTAMFIEGRDEQLCIAHLDSFEDIKGTVARYRETLNRLPATAIYGLYRSSAIRKTRLFERHLASDIAFVQELSIHGDFIQVPALLFTYVGRRHWNTVDQDYRAIYGRPKKPFWYLPFLVLFANQAKRIASSPVGSSTKLRLLLTLAAYQLRHVALKLIVKAAGRICPRQRRDALGSALYYRWLHSPNVTVCSRSLFHERVIRPTLGWWRTAPQMVNDSLPPPSTVRLDETPLPSGQPASSGPEFPRP